jgi:hypothetical protein
VEGRLDEEVERVGARRLFHSSRPPRHSSGSKFYLNNIATPTRRFALEAQRGPSDPALKSMSWQDLQAAVFRASFCSVQRRI